MGPVEPAPSPTPVASTTAALSRVMAHLSQGERLIATGGLLVLVVGEFLLGALLGGGGVGITSVLATTTVLVALGLRHSGPAPLLSAQLYGVVLVVLVALVAVPALDSLLATIHTGLGPLGGLDILFLLAYWIGAALMAWGAIVHWRSAAR